VQVILFRESRVTPRAIHRYAQEVRPKLLKFIQYFIIERHLIAADRTPVCRVKRQHDRSSAEFAQRHRLVGRATQCELGRLGSGSQDCMLAGILGGGTHINAIQKIRLFSFGLLLVNAAIAWVSSNRNRRVK
jgi:hypothetical protein